MTITMPVLLIAIRNLFGERGRLLITIGGVAFSVLLILVLVGLYQGWQKQMTRFLGTIQADYWISQKGAKDMSHSLSLLPPSLKDQLAAEDYIDKVVPFVGRQVSFEIDGVEAHLFVVGADQEPAIRPYKIIEGRDFVNRGEIIVDKAFAKPKGVAVGDELAISDKKYRVVGISEGGNLLVYTYAITTYDDAKEIFQLDAFDNYYLIQSADPRARQNLENDFGDLLVRTKQEFLDANAALLDETFLPIIAVLLVISLLVGLAVIALTIYTATIEKANEYGVLKAIGFTNSQLFGVAFYQAEIAGIIGFVIGAILTPLIASYATEQVSGFIYELNLGEIIVLFGVVLALSALASLVPLRRIFAIDPAKVFKA